ncbi:hypothetical protein BJV77DRAFT_244187 [Russula vinacea]|nr:hypothetical protein BJV77DRAFT_244187 [Russula vinacea]
MKDLCARLPRPLPQDNDLFCEVDVMLAELWRSYERLTNFWKEEIRHVAEAVKTGRIDPRDFERWSNIHPSLEQTIELWKVQNCPPGGDTRTQRSNIITSSITGVDLGAIASSLSSAIGSLGEALERMSSSASLQYSQLGRSSFQQVYVAFAGNSGLCLSLLRNCTDYGANVLAWCFPSSASSTSPKTSSRAGAAYDIRERITKLRPEVTGVSAKSIETFEGGSAPVRGLRTHGPSTGPATGTGTPPTHYADASHDPTLHSFPVPRATDKDPPKPVIMYTPPPCEPQGLQSTVGLEDGQRILGQDNILPRYPRESFLPLTWLPLKDKVLVCCRFTPLLLLP